jgi:hypothetical protein
LKWEKAFAEKLTPYPPFSIYVIYWLPLLPLTSSLSMTAVLLCCVIFSTIDLKKDTGFFLSILWPKLVDFLGGLVALFNGYLFVIKGGRCVGALAPSFNPSGERAFLTLCIWGWGESVVVNFPAFSWKLPD